MNQFTVRDGNTVFKRVSKVAARKVYESGKPVVLCPVKLYPFGGFRPSCMVQRNLQDEESRAKCELKIDSFDDVVQNFQWYNCNLNETGKYASFYVAVK
jgi:hypothetical protein